MTDEIKNLVRFSHYRKDKEVFSEYICGQLLKLAKENSKNGFICFAAAVGTDKEQVLFKCDEHMMHRAAQRLGLRWAQVVLAEVIETVEKCPQLGDELLDAEDKAYEKGYQYGMVALLIDVYDIFVYLHIENGQVLVATAMSFPVYYVNPDCESICRIDRTGNIHLGFENNPRFRKSQLRKFKGRQ